MNVLEHVSDPFTLLGQLRRILKPGGLLLIDVPNNSVVSLRGGLRQRWPELDLGEHVNHFVPATPDRLLIRAGFAPEDDSSECTKELSLSLSLLGRERRLGGWFHQWSCSHPCGECRFLHT
jgi:SAM-dependent methyltransferase